MTATRYRALQLQRSYAAPQNMCISIRAAARMDVPKLRASRAARCNYSAATPRPHRWFFKRTRAARSRHRATARCNYHAAEPRSKTCVFPFARQREWMCQNYWHRAQRDATTARLRRALTHDSLTRTRYRAFQLHAATPRHTRATRDTRSLRSLTAKCLVI